MNVLLGSRLQSTVAGVLLAGVKPIRSGLLEALVLEWPMVDEGTQRWMESRLTDEQRKVLPTSSLGQE